MAATGDVDVGRIGRDPETFEAFYRMHVAAVQRFVARRVDDPYLVADLTAEVFLAAIESSHTYLADRGAPIAWLFGVARNVLAAERRRQARELDSRSRVGGRRLVEADDLLRLEERIDAEARSRDLWHAMKELSSGERAVIELVVLDGLEVVEAAQALGISKVSARVRLHRARRRLRQQLRPTAMSNAWEVST